MTAPVFVHGAAWNLTGNLAGHGGITGSPSAASNLLTLPYGSLLSDIDNDNFGGLPSSAGLVGNLRGLTGMGTDDWGGAIGDVERFASGAFLGNNEQLAFQQSSANGWKLRYQTSAGALIALGTVEHTWASRPAPSVLRDASGARYRFFLDGVKEIDISGQSTAGFSTACGETFGSNNTHAGKNQYVGVFSQYYSFTADEYLNAITHTYAVGNAAGGAYGGTAFSTTTPGNVDDWPGTADDATTMDSDAGNLGVTYRFYMATANFSLANIMGAEWHGRYRTSAAGKSDSIYACIGDGTNKTETAVKKSSGTNWLYGAATFPLNPAGTAWVSATDTNAFEIGIRHDVDNPTGANICDLTAMLMEFFAATFASDPTPASDRRRLLAQIM